MGNKLVEALSSMRTSSVEVIPDILILEFTIVNAFLVGNPQENHSEFVLIDTGLGNSSDFIVESIEKRFGKGRTPQAIILTHGHFDHVGSVIKLSELWDIPVYAHELEIPYLTGEKDYPLGDPTVDSGMVAKLSPTFPHTSIDISSSLKTLPSDGTVPSMEGWKWIHTPGHADGHISLFRESDGVLIVGDAFTTTKQESLWSVLTQKEEINGPPAYLTTDWEAAKKSIKVLRDLKPSLAIASHGQPLKGEELTEHLEFLVKEFDKIAKPEQGKFIHK
jgi:glyoxylase-like metal-dependent hydrolase (beta-lactamase superfamily II)